MDMSEEALYLLCGTDASRPRSTRLTWKGNGSIKALDAKFNFDSDALYRHPEIVAYECGRRRRCRGGGRRVRTSDYMAALDGNIGFMVNGAGLAMATMDAVELFGGEPANFLDVGGGATPEKVTEAFESCSPTTSRASLVEVFGGVALDSVPPR